MMRCFLHKMIWNFFCTSTELWKCLQWVFFTLYIICDILVITLLCMHYFSDKGESGLELFPVYIVQQVHPWLPDSEAKLARQDGAHLWLGIQNWREMLQCLNVVSVCADASITLWCLGAFYVCDIFIFYFPKTLTNIFLISTWQLLWIGTKVIVIALF